MRAIKVALRPENEAPRRSGKTERGTANYINNNDTSNSLSEWQVQRVITVSGVSPAIARIIAPLAFGGVA